MVKHFHQLSLSLHLGVGRLHLVNYLRSEHKQHVAQFSFLAGHTAVSGESNMVNYFMPSGLDVASWASTASQPWNRCLLKLNFMSDHVLDGTREKLYHSCRYYKYHKDHPGIVSWDGHDVYLSEWETMNFSKNWCIVFTYSPVRSSLIALQL